MAAHAGVYEAALDRDSDRDTLYISSWVLNPLLGEASSRAHFYLEDNTVAHGHACRVNERPSITTPAPRMSGTKNTNESSQLLSASEAFELTTNSVL